MWPPRPRRSRFGQTFGRRRTLAIGAAFGVITVVGPVEAGSVQVATFRADAGYSDGRHPDRVSYTTAEADAQRRDFTVNGLFLDPLTDRVLDFVGGQADLQRRIIRAIGDPSERIGEDKLRMLRAVRFATTLNFQLESSTLTAIQRHAAEICAVSGERIAEEMRKLLTHADRRRRRSVVGAEPVCCWRSCPRHSPLGRRTATASGFCPVGL